jgi:putative ABC transport system permease protein
VENGVSISPIWGVGLTRPEHTVKYLDKRFEEKEFLSADSNFFDVFPISFVEGSPMDALKIPYGLVISQSTALKYFGTEPALGKTFKIDGDVNLTITGVTIDVPHNTHFTYDFLVSYVTMKALDLEDNEGTLSDYYTWNDFGHFNYILLESGADPRQVEEKIMEWLPNYIDFTPEIIEEIARNRVELILQPVTEIHLRSHMVWELGNNGNIVYVYAFSATALLILIIAILNFINLSTARSARRARETGVRKTMGAFRRQLISQFLGESLLLTLMAVVLAAILVEVLMPAFSSFTGKDFSRIISDWPVNILVLLFVTVFVGLLSGSYPSVYLSSFLPAHILKGITGIAQSKIRLRKILVIIQFAISVFLIIAALGIGDQLRYIQSKNLGININQVVVIPLRSAPIQNQFAAFRQTLLQNPGILNVSGISNIPGGQFNNNDVVWKDPQQYINSSEMWVDDEFINLMEIDITAGRGFSSEFSADSIASFILNETACKRLNITDPIGEIITWEGDYPGTIHGKVIGVVKDFNYKSLHDDIAPLIIQRVNENWQRAFLLIRITSKEMSGTLRYIEKTWKQFEPDLGFKYTFFDEDFTALYEAEDRMAIVFRIFTLLGIMLA